MPVNNIFKYSIQKIVFSQPAKIKIERRHNMNIKLLKGVICFFIFLGLGIGAYGIFDSIVVPNKPIVTEEDSLPEQGTISEVAARVSRCIVGVTNLSSEGDLFNQRNVEKTGSGVIIDKEGYIVTNNHVVNKANRLIITLADGNEKEAQIIGTDPRTDLALLKIDVNNHVTAAVLGDSNNLQVGQEVIAIGNPLGLRFARSVTAGVVSGLNRLLTTEEGFVFRLIQTDAAINPGNSGGALVNLGGEVIGINSIKIAVEGFEGMGFSIPSNQVKMVVDDIRKYGKVQRPLMGIKILGELSQDQAKYFNLPVEKGVIVEPVINGPAAEAGIKKYDIITTIDKEAVETGLELQEKIFSKKIGQTVDVRIVRLPAGQTDKNETKTLKVTLDK
jgi:serine protease Do